MMLSGQALCLVLAYLAISATLGAVTDDEKETIQKGIEAGKDFADALETQSITKVLGKMNDVIGPWVDGIGIFSSVLGMFLPEDTELLDEMKKGFKEVNKRLDAIQEGLTEVKEAIDWAVVKVNFQGIEQDIRLMDGKLSEVIQAPAPEDGKEEYIRVYENEYNEAGFLLYDSIVNDDQIFYENIVRAGMTYTEYHRAKMSDFMKGLIVLLMKATDIEVSYESFKEQDRGMGSIWKARLTETQEALTKADGVLEDAWKDLFRGEVDKLSKELDGWDHVSFRDAVYSFLAGKYPWMYWFVLAYDDVRGWDNHALQTYVENGHHQFEHYGRNFLVASAYPSASFDHAAAQADIKDRDCPESSRWCSDNSALSVLNDSPWHGVGKAVVRASKGWAVVGIRGRLAYGKMHLRRGSWAREHSVFYFG